ncbi:MAG: hypothetical protein K5897_06835 [Eubacterium sp.]|nr:hypothetical protein [Eubacterium sp.]
MGHSLVFLLENLFAGFMMMLAQSKMSEELVGQIKWFYLFIVIGFAGMNMLHFLLEKVLRERLIRKAGAVGKWLYRLILFLCLSTVGFGTQSAFAEVSGIVASISTLLDMGMAFAFMHLFMDFLIRRVNHTVTGRMLNMDDGDDPDDDDDYFDDDMD